MTEKVCLALGAFAAVWLTGPASAAAHGLVVRRDLPIPIWLFAWAAIAVLVISFIALAVVWRKPVLEKAQARGLFGLPAVIEAAFGAVGVAVFAGVAYAGLAGEQTPATNIVPTFVYVVFWVGVPLSSAIFGDWFRWFNPWVAIAKLVRRVAAEFNLTSTTSSRKYPEWLGRWPAVAGVLIFAWVELAFVNRSDPSTLATMMLAYAAFQWVGMGAFGLDAWARRGDTFGTYFALFGRMAPIGIKDREVSLRWPLTGLPSLNPIPGTVALLCVMIGTTSFDGFSNGGLWQQIVPSLASALGVGDPGNDGGYMWPATVVMVLVVLVVAALYYAGVAGMPHAGGQFDTRELARRFAHSLVPIAFAYLVSHYLTLAIFQGQTMFFLISDPLGNGSDLFGTANVAVSYSVISGNLQWYAQVGALVAGHVAGLALAHDRALTIYRNSRDASRSQYWMLVVMAAYTSLALWLLSDLSM